MPKIQRDLNGDPSEFKGDNRPVERVSWNDAVEFCQRLSQQTGQDYRLPSEAEWEYACRAGTKTPFHFGETLDSSLANYNATETYGEGVKGEYRKQTTNVGVFPANAFGLYDMHGNVWEWCADCWHENYKDAPTDGSVWLADNLSDRRIVRGGSWCYLPRYCRSAYRNDAYARQPRQLCWFSSELFSPQDLIALCSFALLLFSSYARSAIKIFWLWWLQFSLLLARLHQQKLLQGSGLSLQGRRLSI